MVCCDSDSTVTLRSVPRNSSNSDMTECTSNSVSLSVAHQRRFTGGHVFMHIGALISSRCMCSLASASMKLLQRRACLGSSDFRFQVASLGRCITVTHGGFSKTTSSSSSSRRLFTSRMGAAQEAAASSLPDAEVAEDEKDIVYDAEYSPGFVNYVCITGTIQSVKAIKASSSWLWFSVKVPTPASDSLTDWNVLAHGDLADLAAPRAQEGQTVQAVGTLLQPESLQRLRWNSFMSGNAIFMESIGFIEHEPPEDILQKTIVPPAMSEADLQAFIASGGQQTRAQAPLPPIPVPAAAAITPPDMPVQASTEVEAAWMSVFLENHLWVDQRLTKKGKQPDFKLRDKAIDGRKDALWLTDRQLPTWVRRNLQLLPGGMAYPLPGFIPAAALTGSVKEQQWVEVFANYNNFWDNRRNKLSERGPDFAPKDKSSGGPALWLNDAPGWVLQNLNALPEPPGPRQQA